MVTGNPPFTTATPNDPYYRALAAGKLDLFWNTHTQDKGDDCFSDEFKDLMSSMFQLDPKDRLNTQGLLEHAWVTAACPSHEEMIVALDAKKAAYKESMEGQQESKAALKE
jgi:serine/threonine protein kinase